MAFISNIKEPKDVVGSTRTLLRDCSAIIGTITKGSKVIVTGYSNRGFDIQDIESGECLTECGFDCVKYFKE